MTSGNGAAGMTSGTVTLATSNADNGNSGKLLLSSGQATNSGSVHIESGSATGQPAGDISLIVGDSSGIGGSISIAAGVSTTSTGGSVQLQSGSSSSLKSGEVNVLSAASTESSGRVFKTWDTDNSGTLTIDEMQKALSMLNVSVDVSAMKALFSLFDDDYSGEIESKEFIDAIRHGDTTPCPVIYRTPKPAMLSTSPCSTAIL